MATAIKNLTKMGTDVRKIAALLRAKAPEGHMLAYISPEEAQVLKDRGGSGKPHADTGIPSFELDDDLSLQGDTGATSTPSPSGGGNYGGDVQYGGAITPLPSYDIQPSPVANVQADAPTLTRSLASAPPEQAIAPIQGYVPTPTAPQPYQATSADKAALLGDQGYGEKASPAELKAAETAPPPKDKGMSEQTMKQLGIAGLGALLGASQARKAQASGQAGAQQLQQLATPYQTQGAQLQAQAQAGQLTPAGQQSLQALQAQVAQGAQARGGVGVQQGAQAVEALRQQLLAGQYQLGLQISGIGDKIATGAIQAGMQADQYTNQLTSSYFNNIARIAAGVPTGTFTTPGSNQ
jgi:hypothetical protein